MNEKYKTLANLLAFGKISKDEFLSQYLDGKDPDRAYYLDLLKRGIAHKDLEVIRECLTIVSIAHFDKKEFSKYLCELLKSDWHYHHEFIATILKEIKDPNTVDCLYHAIGKSFQYLDYDDTYQFARKCIKALSTIGNEEAFAKLLLLTNGHNDQIAAYASKELKYHQRL